MFKEFIYRLKNSSGNYYRVEGSNLIADTEISELEHAPDGWQQKSINWKRNWDSFGVIRGFTIPLRFVLDGAEILKYLFYEYGYEADCILEIFQSNENRDYDLIFSGEIDFTTYEQINDFVSVSAIEGGAQKLVNAAKDTIFEIPVNNSDAINVRLDGINLFSKVKFNIDTVSFGEATDGGFLSPFTYLSSEGENLYLFPADFLPLTNVSGGYETSSNDWMFTTGSELSIRFVGSLNLINRSVPSGTTISLNIRCSNGTAFNIVSFTATNFTQKTPFDITHVIPSGVKCFLEIVSNNSFNYWSKGSYLNLEFLNRKPETYSKALMPITLFNELCKKIGVIGHSDLLQNIPIGITSLDGILNINDSGIIKTKLSDFLKFCFTRFSSTWYIDELDRLRIESINTAFNDTETISIDKIKDFKVNILRDPLFNLISAGYETQTVDEVNGKYGFNAKQQWRSDVKKINNTLDMICPYIADPYAIELNRIKLEGKTTTDSKSDNNVFLLSYDPSFTVTAKDKDENDFSAYTLKRYAAMTGVYDDTVFNFDLSPKHGLVNNARLIKSLLWKAADTITLQSGEKNTEVASADFVEKSDLNLNGYPGLFTPVSLSFEPLVEDLIYPVLKSNPRGKVRFNLYGYWFYGFVSEISIQPKTGTTQNWTLISAPENNLMLLSELAGRCEVVSFDTTVPNGAKDFAYLHEIELHGTSPFTLSYTETNGINLEVMGSKLRISGTPTTAGIIALAFTLMNCSGSKDYTINLQVNNATPPSGIAIQTNYSASGESMELEIGWISSGFESEVYLYKNGILESGFPQIFASGDSFFVHGAEFNSTYKVRVRNKSGSEYSDFIEQTYITPQRCNSYTINNDRRVSYIEYVDCNGVTQNVTLAAYQSITFCARSITPTGASIINNGLC